MAHSITCSPFYNEYKVLKENNLLPDTDQCSLLIKGGHRKDLYGTDVLIENRKKTLLFPGLNIENCFSKHGSGCVLSSAITADRGLWSCSVKAYHPTANYN